MSMIFSRKTTTTLGVAAALLLCGYVLPGLGATANVTVGPGGSLSFNPATTTINVGDSVTWTWGSSGHSTTSSTSLWDSSVQNSPHTFTHTFTTSGTFSYVCIPHAAFGMVGSVVVNAAVNIPPVITITNPASGTTLSAPASLLLAASATDSDGSVTNVKFFQGTVPLGNVTAAPFSVSVNNLAAANYTFSAIASDNGGLTATNSITVYVINPSPLTLSTPAVSPSGHFQFNYAADVGLTYVVQVSTNLIDWNPVNTNTATVNPAVFTDPNVDISESFYRVGRLPNP